MDDALKSALDDAFAEARAEAERAINRHGRYASLHEAYGVLLEEVDEFKAEVYRKSERRDLPATRSELVQVAAVAIKAAVCFTGAAEGRSSKLMSERQLPTLSAGEHFRLADGSCRHLTWYVGGGEQVMVHAQGHDPAEDYLANRFRTVDAFAQAVLDGRLVRASASPQPVADGMAGSARDDTLHRADSMT